MCPQEKVVWSGLIRRWKLEFEEEVSIAPQVADEQENWTYLAVVIDIYSHRVVPE